MARAIEMASILINCTTLSSGNNNLNEKMGLS
jgi:hypothetical protein